MKKLIRLFTLATVLLLTSNCLMAQDFAIGLRGGIGTRTLTNGESIFNAFDNSLNVDPEGAIFAEFKMSKAFSIQPMVEFSPQGSKQGDFINTDPIDGATYQKKAQLNYLMFPVLAKVGCFIPDSRFRIYADAGPFISFLLSARQLYTQTQYDANTQQVYETGYYAQDVKYQLKTVNAGLEGNLGIAYYFRNCNIFLEAGGNYGLANVQRFVAPGNKTGGADISLGISFWFDKLDYRTASYFPPYGK